MGIISRVTTFVAGTVADPAQVNAELDRIHNEFNGNIDDANVKPLAGIAQSKITNLTTDLGARLLKAGDTMTGPLVLPADPTLALQAATKQYTDNGLAAKAPAIHTHAGGDITTAVVNATNAGTAATANAAPWAGITGKPASFTPTAHKATHTAGGTDVLTPADIGAAALVGANFTGALQQNGSNVWHAGNLGPGHVFTLIEAEGTPRNSTNLVLDTRFLWDDAFAVGRAVYLEAVMWIVSATDTGTCALTDYTNANAVVGSVSVPPNGAGRYRSADIKTALVHGHELNLKLTSTGTAQVYVSGARLIIL